MSQVQYFNYLVNSWPNQRSKDSSNDNNNKRYNDDINNNNHNCVNNKMLECDRLLTALIYGLIDCFRSKLFDYKHL